MDKVSQNFQKVCLLDSDRITLFLFFRSVLLIFKIGFIISLHFTFMLNILVFLFLPCMNDLNDFNHTGNTTWNLLLVLTPPLKWSRKNWTLYFRVCLAQSIVELSLPLIQSLDFYYYQLTEKAMAAHSSTLAWKIPWTEEPGRLQSMGLLRVGHD